VADALDRLIDAHQRGADPATIAELTRDWQRQKARMLRRLDQYLHVLTSWAVSSGQMTQAEVDELLASCNYGVYNDSPPALPLPEVPGG